MPTALPPEVEVPCVLRCRVVTLHRLSGSLGGRALYGCTNSCGAPLREISDPQSKTPAFKAAELAMFEAQKKKWEKEAARDTGVAARPFVNRRQRAPQRKETIMPKPKAAPQTTSNASPLVDRLKTIVGELLADQQPAGLTEDRVREIFAEELEKQLGGAPSGAPPAPQRPARAAAPRDADGAAAPAAAKTKAGLELPDGFKCVREQRHNKCPTAWCVKAFRAEAAA